MSYNRNLHSHRIVEDWGKNMNQFDGSWPFSEVVGDVMLWRMFSRHASGILIPTEHRVNSTVNLSCGDDHLHPLSLSCNSYIQQDTTPYHQDWFHDHNYEFIDLTGIPSQQPSN